MRFNILEKQESTETGRSFGNIKASTFWVTLEQHWINPGYFQKITSFRESLKMCFITAWKMSKYGVFSGPNTGKYGPEKTPHLDTFYAVLVVGYDY